MDMQLQNAAQPAGYQLAGAQMQPVHENPVSPQQMALADQGELKLALELQKEYLQAREAERMERLDALGMEISKKRLDAIQARSNFGIEQDWLEDEEMYQGVDDANRGESKFLSSKPTTAGTTISNNAKPQTRSTAFLNITRPYTDAAAARIGDILLPVDDKPYAVEPVPIPDLLAGMDDVHTINMPDGTKISAGDFKQALDSRQKEAELCAQRAETRIDDWLVGCQWHAEARLVIDDWTRLGTGIFRGPIPTKKKSMAWVSENGQMGLVIREDIKPTSRRVNPLDFFPDPACGENIHNGSYVFERDTITAKGLLELKGTPGYLAEQIELCLQEGPAIYTQSGKVEFSEREHWDKNKFEIWYFHGLISEADLEAAGFVLPEKAQNDSAGMAPGIEASGTGMAGSIETGIGPATDPAAASPPNSQSEGERIPAVLTMVNDHVIKAAMHPLDSGEFPYDVVVWQRRSGMPWGMGVARQIRVPQRMINAATRNLMDNAGLSAKPILVMFKDWVKKATSSNTMTPGDVYHISPEAFEAGLTNASMAISTIEIPTRQQELLGIIQFALKMAEDVTGLPQLLQGQQGKAPDTVGGMQLLQANASGVIRRIAKSFDSSITEPHIRRYYEYLMMYGPEESEKGEFQIDAKGSSSFVDRDIETQFVVQMAQLVANPAYGIDPKRWFAVTCKLRRFDPSQVQYTEAELKKQAQEQQQKPQAGPPPEVIRAQAAAQAAQTRAQSEAQKAQTMAQSAAQTAQTRAQAEAQAAATAAQAEVQRAQIAAQAVVSREQQIQQNETEREQARNELARMELDSKIQLATIARETAMMELSIKQNISLNQIKAMLADTAMREQSKKELAALDHHMQMVGDVAKDTRAMQIAQVKQNPRVVQVPRGSVAAAQAARNPASGAQPARGQSAKNQPGFKPGKDPKSGA
jgi:hypothetical protein